MPKPTTRWSLARLQRITTSSHRYLAEVDGLRFIAIFSVLLFHVFFVATHVPGTVLVSSAFDFLLWPIANGHRGVELFFVISGFILGLPFAMHYVAGGPRLKIGRFYLRRLTRLEPPYVLALLLFYGAASVLQTPDASDPGFLASLLLRLGYAHGVVRGVPPSLNGVTWTLEIEVQFYLLAPLLAQIYRFQAWPRRGSLILAICLAPLLSRALPGSDMTLLRYAQYFLTGLLLADLHCTGAGAGWLPRWALDVLGICGLLAVAFVPDSPGWPQLFPWLLALIFVGALRGRWLTSVLRRPTISVLGGMCYSLYLLHYPLYSFLADRIVGNGMSLPLACLRVGVVALPIAVGAGIAYYILIERPCMDPNWPQAAGRGVLRMIGAVKRAVRRPSGTQH